MAPERLNRDFLPFRAVNRRGQTGYQAGLQRHHLLPRQMLREPSFAALVGSLGRPAIGFDDFRRNGLLLPASETAALRTGLPLHRGPHRFYNELVFERVGQIEARWRRRGQPDADREALWRMALLQRALRRRLLSDRRRPAMLSRHDPTPQALDFSLLDNLADQLWSATEGAEVAEPEAVGA